MVFFYFVLVRCAGARYAEFEQCVTPTTACVALIMALRARKRKSGGKFVTFFAVTGTHPTDTHVGSPSDAACPPATSSLNHGVYIL
jgi:hypothetical protein